MDDDLSLCNRCFGTCCKCLFPPVLAKNQMFAKMKIDVEIIPKAVAELTSFEDNVNFRPPADRLSYRVAAMNPMSTCKMLLGPTRTKRVKCACLACIPGVCGTVVLLVV